MPTSITLRSTKGSALTYTEVDNNFSNLKTTADAALPSATAAITYQPLDGDLTAIAGLTGTSGLLKKTAADTWLLDTSSYITGNQTITVSGDATGSGSTAITLTLANSGVTAGTYQSVTVDAKGRVTAGTNPAIAISDVTNLQTSLDAKQATLVSGTNIKTINGTTLLGSGDLTVASSSATLTIDSKTGAYTVVAGDLGKIINCTSGTFTVFLTAAATLGAGFNCWIWNTSDTVADLITIDPNGSETIDGVSTLILRRGEGMQIVCNGTNWQTGDKKVMRGYAENVTQTIVRPVASGDGSLAVGFYATASASYSMALQSGTAGSTYSFIAGRNSGSNGSVTSTGAGAMALGGSYASGTDSFAAAVGNNTSTYGATGANSVALGQFSKASSPNSLAIASNGQATAQYSAVLGGNNSIASGIVSFALGAQCTSSGQYSFSSGENSTASGNYSYALGRYTNAALYGKKAFASGRFVATGDAQFGTLILRRQTTDATATVLTSDGGAAAATNQVVLPNDSTFAFRILVVARRTDADNESAGYEFTGVVDRNATAASTALVGTVTKTVLAEDTAAWDVNVTADTTNGGLAVTVTGEAAKTINWVATCWTSEVTG